MACRSGDVARRPRTVRAVWTAVATAAALCLCGGVSAQTAPTDAPASQPFAREDLDDSLVTVSERTIELKETILFFLGEARIKPESFPVINKLADTLKARPGILKVLIAGHTDSVGADDFNLTLSMLRAEAVRTYLVEHGVEPRRLEADGYGESRPRVKNQTEEERQINRRVEFLMVERDAATRAGSKPAGLDVVALHGDAWEVRGENDGIPLVARQRLRGGVALATGPGARVVLRAPDLGLVVIGPNTRLKLSRVELGGSGGTRDVSIKLLHGDVEIRDRVGGRAVVFTPWASATGRGAHFRAVTGPDGSLIVTAGRGELEISAAGNLSALPAGMATVLPQGGMPLPPSPRLPAPTATTARHDAEAADRLAWSAVQGATGYVVTLSRDAEALDVLAVLPTSTAAVLASDLPDPSLGFWWQVQALDALNILGRPSKAHHWVAPPRADRSRGETRAAALTQ